MELRTLLLILCSICLPSVRGAGPILRYPLDERAVYTVRIGTDTPTTVMFPGPISALDAAGISGKADDHPSVLLAHQEGSRFFSVRALHADSAGAANVVFRDRVFAFAFVASDAPDRTVTFHEDAGSPPGSASARPGPERLLALLDLAKNYAALADQHPALVQRIGHTTPGTATVRGSLAIIIEEIFRFEDEDAVILRARLENRGQAALRYSPAQLGVNVGASVLPAALTDASGLLPAGRSSIISLVILAKSDGSPGGLSLKNNFALVLAPVTPVE